MQQKKPRILIVDDDASVLLLVREVLDKRYDVEVARDGIQALEKVRRSPPDLLLLDLMMPKMNGLEVCRIIKAQTPENFVPIILVTVKSDVQSKVKGLRLGADDYLTKPFNTLELEARVESMLRIKSLQDKLNERKRELEALSVTDDLTGLFNHRAMQQRLTEEFQRAKRHNEPLSVVMIDADHFKSVNDTHGHLFGDVVLHRLAEIIRDSVREIDIVARYGGEEFLVILPRTHFSGALAVADRIWRCVKEARFTDNTTEHNMTVSLGLSFYPNARVHTVDDLVRCADEALYRAKREGRDRICLHQHLNYSYRPGEPSAKAIAEAVARNTDG